MSRRMWLTATLVAALCPFAVLSSQTAQRDSLAIGSRTVPAGTTERGPLVVAGGDLTIAGTVNGSAIAIAGDVVVLPGGEVTGDAIAAFGEVRNQGQVGGASRALTGTFGASLRALLAGSEAKPATPRSPLELALGWFTVMMLIGLGVLVFASPYLDGVVDVLGQSFWRSFLTGLAGHLGILPVILLVVVALAVTVIGILLVPFAIVALVLVVAGLLALGFVAAARVTGDGLGGRRARGLSEKGGALRGVIVGTALYMGLWVAAAALGDTPVLGVAVRVLALLATFVAATAGFGAAILSRGGTRRDAAISAPEPAAEVGWQTPTPVTGVAAARRRPAAGSGAAH
ncbi:MAG: hypothetical protein JNL26_20565 [Gemmatimonadetes bacterium]|nr:hypothetical protein [Gemmatimonadota bacterium]